MLKYLRVESSRISRNKIEPIFQLPPFVLLGSSPPFDKLIYSCHQASISRVTIHGPASAFPRVKSSTAAPFRFVATIGRVISEDTVNKVFISAWRPVNGGGKLSSRNSSGIRADIFHVPSFFPSPFLSSFAFFFRSRSKRKRILLDRSRIATGAKSE